MKPILSISRILSTQEYITLCKKLRIDLWGVCESVNANLGGKINCRTSNGFNIHVWKWHIIKIILSGKMLKVFWLLFTLHNTIPRKQIYGLWKTQMKKKKKKKLTRVLGYQRNCEVNEKLLKNKPTSQIGDEFQPLRRSWEYLPIYWGGHLIHPNDEIA